MLHLRFCNNWHYLDMLNKEIYITPHCVTPGDVHFSLGISPQFTVYYSMLHVHPVVLENILVIHLVNDLILE